MRRKTIVAMMLAVALAGFAVPATAAGHEATLNVVHGVPGLSVNVCAGPAGGPLGVVIKKFQYQDVVTMTLEPGTYDAKVVAAGKGCGADAILSASGLALAGGDNVDVVAHLLEGGAPNLAVFANQTFTLGKEKTSITVRHAADAPEVDVWGSKRSFDLRRAQMYFGDVPNGAEGEKRLKRGWRSIAVTPAGTTTPVIGPAAFNLQKGTGYIIYAVGSLTGSLDLVIHTIDRS